MSFIIPYFISNTTINRRPEEYILKGSGQYQTDVRLVILTAPTASWRNHPSLYQPSPPGQRLLSCPPSGRISWRQWKGSVNLSDAEFITQNWCDFRYLYIYCQLTFIRANHFNSRFTSVQMVFNQVYLYHLKKIQ